MTVPRRLATGTTVREPVSRWSDPRSSGHRARWSRWRGHALSVVAHDCAAHSAVWRIASPVAVIVVSEPWSSHGAARAGAPRLKKRCGRLRFRVLVQKTVTYFVSLCVLCVCARSLLAPHG